MDFMKGAQSVDPRTVLIGLLVIFLFQGAFLSLLFPVFQQPDEQVHYGTVQHWAEPEEKGWEMRVYEDGTYFIDGKDIRTSNLPEEAVQTAVIARFDEIKFQKQNTQSFSSSSYGPGEDIALENKWNRYVDTAPSAVSGTKSVYYLFASWIERALSDESIFTRIFSVRMLSVLFGVSVVLIAYLLARKVGFSEISSLAFSWMVAFQPMFAVTAAQANIDIALVFSFSLFLYAGVSFLRSVDERDPSTALGMIGGWLGMIGGRFGMTKWALLAVAAAIFGFFSKGPGIVLVAALYPLFAWGAYRRLGISWRKFLAYLAIATVAFAGLAFLAVPKSYIAGITNSASQSTFDSPFRSIGKYLGKTMDNDEFRETHASYWGNFGWLDTQIDGSILDIIRYVEIIGFMGVLVYLLVPVLKKKNWIPAFAGMTAEMDDKAGWLPERKYVVFLLGMMLALQFAIRFYDWRMFDATGQLLIGTPGRYFLPNLLGHLVVVLVGLRIAVSWMQRVVIPSLSRNLSWIAASKTPRNDKIDFEVLMKTGLVAMVLLQTYSIFWVIIPRYYL